MGTQCKFARICNNSCNAYSYFILNVPLCSPQLKTFLFSAKVSRSAAQFQIIVFYLFILFWLLVVTRHQRFTTNHYLSLRVHSSYSLSLTMHNFAVVWAWRVLVSYLKCKLISYFMRSTETRVDEQYSRALINGEPLIPGIINLSTKENRLKSPICSSPPPKSGHLNLNVVRQPSLSISIINSGHE